MVLDAQLWSPVRIRVKASRLKVAETSRKAMTSQTSTAPKASPHMPGRASATAVDAAKAAVRRVDADADITAVEVAVVVEVAAVAAGVVTKPQNVALANG